MIDGLFRKIDFQRPAMILQYGAGRTAKVASFSKGPLPTVPTKDLGEGSGEQSWWGWITS